MNDDPSSDLQHLNEDWPETMWEWMSQRNFQAEVNAILLHWLPTDLDPVPDLDSPLVRMTTPLLIALQALCAIAQRNYPGRSDDPSHLSAEMRAIAALTLAHLEHDEPSP